jgi:hypothetical protein
MVRLKHQQGAVKINSTEQNPFRESDSGSTTEEIPVYGK